MGGLPGYQRLFFIVVVSVLFGRGYKPFMLIYMAVCFETKNTVMADKPPEQHVRSFCGCPCLRRTGSWRVLAFLFFFRLTSGPLSLRPIYADSSRPRPSPVRPSSSFPPLGSDPRRQYRRGERGGAGARCGASGAARKKEDMRLRYASPVSCLFCPVRLRIYLKTISSRSRMGPANHAFFNQGRNSTYDFIWFDL